MVHTMCPATSTVSTTNVPDRSDQKAVDALSEFLQDMSKTIQALSIRHDMVCQIYQACPTDNSTDQTWVSLRTPFISPATPAKMALCHFEDRRNSFKQDRRRTIDIVEQHGSPGKNAEQTSQKTLLDVKTLDALRGFLEDMKTTIQTWSDRHNLLVRSHSISVEPRTQVLVIGTPTRRSPIRSTSLSMPFTDHALSSSEASPRNLDVVQTPPQPDREGINVGQSAQPDQDVKNMEQKVKVDQEVNVVDVPQLDRNRRLEINLVQSPRFNYEEGSEPDLPQSNPEEDIASRSPQSDDKTSMDKTVKEVVDLSHLQEGNVKGTVALSQSSSELQATSPFGHEEMDTEFTVRPESTTAHGQPMPHADQEDKAVESPSWLTKKWIAEVERQVSSYIEYNERKVEMKAQGSDFKGQQVMQQPYRRIVKVVESPEWLPEGWITEVKIRGRGNSAGSKDKYFYDPATKRRFRSKREVFCFLETGKLDRYKPKCKNKLEDKFDTNQSSVDHNSKSQFTSAPAGCIPVNLSTSCAPLASGCRSVSSISPPGLFGSVFMPFRTGQPSDWLVYESLSSVPVPVFERFPQPEKDFTRLNGSRFFSDGWVFSNSEGAWRTYPCRNEMRKGFEGKNISSSQTFGGLGMQFSETVQRHSAAGTRTMSKSS